MRLLNGSSKLIYICILYRIMQPRIVHWTVHWLNLRSQIIPFIWNNNANWINYIPLLIISFYWLLLLRRMLWICNSLSKDLIRAWLRWWHHSQEILLILTVHLPILKNLLSKKFKWYQIVSFLVQNYADIPFFNFYNYLDI